MSPFTVSATEQVTLVEVACPAFEKLDTHTHTHKHTHTNTHTYTYTYIHVAFQIIIETHFLKFCLKLQVRI